MTSGCHCTPNRRRARSSNAATGLPDDVASTSKPSGAACTASPWLIHTVCDAGLPDRTVPADVTSTAVPPYSRWPVCATVPPSAAAIAWKP